MGPKVAFLFPGQGSQFQGMGRDLVEEFPEAREIFDLVDSICQRSISRLCFEGPMDELTLTVNLQPAITAVNLACLVALQKRGVAATAAAGHSLGEYSALVSSGVVSASNALQLVKMRGELMHRESLQNPGSMAAVIGADISTVREIVARTAQGGLLAIANHNTAEQVVITGEREPLARAVDLMKEEGLKAIPLKVSGAWHCALMENAVPEFREFMADIPFSRPQTTILFNATAAEEEDPERIKDTMAQQLVSAVRWYEIILKMLDDGIDLFLEVGPKKVLSGLMKKIVPPDREVQVLNVEDCGSLQRFVEAVR